jgi:hypothetical protein
MMMSRIAVSPSLFLGSDHSSQITINNALSTPDTSEPPVFLERDIATVSQDEVIQQINAQNLSG